MPRDTKYEGGLFGTDFFGEPINPGMAPLRKRFIVPPFTVLDARSGEWQNRKRAWIKIGIKSEVGRGAVQASLESVRRLQRGEYDGKKAAPGGSPMPAMDYSKGERGDGKGKAIRAAALRDVGLKKLAGFHVGVDAKAVARNKARKSAATQLHWDHNQKREEREEGEPIETWVVSSIFDPVLTELAYRWWCPVNGMVLDPFAGGSVRGIVASSVGCRYWGCDLREEQIAANYEQKAELMPDSDITWVCGDSRDTMKDAPESDFLLTCPPYGDLEIYSEDPKDISGMEFRDFVEAYKDITKKSCDRLKDNRFAVAVVADYRDRNTGLYRNFVSGTIAAYQKAGLHLYNEIILVTVVGTGSLRATRQFRAGRKCVKTHQNVLVFVKGDWRKAVENIKESEKENEDT